MKVIYNEQSAILRKNKIDADLPEENRKARIHNAIWTIPTVLVGALITFLWIWSSIGSSWFDIEMILVSGLAVFGFVALMGWAVLSCNWEPTCESGEYYSALVLYYQATVGKNVLDHELISCQDDFWNKKAYKLKVILENEDHVVSAHKLPVKFSIQTRTDVSEITVDLEKGVVYEPYSAQENGGEEQNEKT